ncbi:MAG: hypothetical protein JSU70_17685 [Phycisphaerales bacterium]|nr:MAG: hypothetical protein JSU70_17685 [Phycisphaerales bacterium]
MVECGSFEQMFEAAGPVVVLIVAVFLLLVSLAVVVIKAVVYCKIFSKAGYSWALGLLMLIPVVCIIMPFVLAFGHWPVHRELEKLREQQASPAA